MQNSVTQSPVSIPSKSTRLRPLLLRWVVLLLLAILLLFQPLRVAFAAYQTYVTSRQLVTVLRTVDHPADLQAAQGAVTAITTNLNHLHATLKPLMPLLAQFEFVPGYGPLLAQADQLIATGEEAAVVFDKGVALIKAATIPSSSRASVEEWVALGPVIAPLAGDLSALEANLAALPLAQIEGAAGERLRQLHALVELATVATQMGSEWDNLLGVTRPVTYLILVQNNHELRPTGGFISAVAPATFVKGELRNVEFVDSYAIFSHDLAYPPAPEPMRDYMGIELLTLRDANWSPDLPSAADVIRTLYQQHTGLAVDGIITIDLDAVALVLPALGHLTIDGSTMPITQANVEQALVQLWNDPANSPDASAPAIEDRTKDKENKEDNVEGDWWSQRKDFIGQLTQAAFVRLQQKAVDPAALAAGIVQALDRRSVQVRLFNPVGQTILNEQAWDGALRPLPNADFLAVVDTNMGYNKVDAVLSRALDYQIRWPDDAALGAEATLTLTYSHPVNVNDPICRAESYYGARYEDMMARCYFNYSRVYVPAGSELLSAQGWIDATITSRRAEQGTQQFAGYFVLNPGTQHRVTLRYRLPPTLRPTNYQLVVQRQAGTDPLALHLQHGDAQFETSMVQGQLIWSP